MGRGRTDCVGFKMSKHSDGCKFYVSQLLPCLITMTLTVPRLSADFTRVVQMMTQSLNLALAERLYFKKKNVSQLKIQDFFKTAANAITF